MKLFNYSGLKSRDTKIYNIGGYNIAGGFSVNFLTVTGPALLVFIIIGWLLSYVFGLSFFNPFAENFSAVYTLSFIIVGILVGLGLYKIQFAGYRLYQYLGAYFKPKKVYTNDFKLKEKKFTDIKINAFVKKLF